MTLHAIATLVRGGVEDSGTGWTDPRSWLVVLAALVLLGVLAWWTVRPARRARRPR